MLVYAFALTMCLGADATPKLVAPPTAAAAPTNEDASGLVSAMVQAFEDGNFPLAFGTLALLLSLLVGAINGFLLRGTAVSDETRKKVLPWLVAAGGCLTAFGLALIAGVGWFNSIAAGLVTSAAATGLWELVIKTAINSLKKKN